METVPAMRLAPVLGRILLALIFLQGGLHKIGTLNAVAAEIAGRGLPAAHLLAIAAMVLEIVLSLMLIAGWQARWAALVLFFYTLLLALLFHAFWAVPPAQARVQNAFFFGHLAIMGGLLFVYASGAGPASFDHARRAARS